MIVGLLLSVLNVGLVAVPIGGAVGTLAGIDYYRRQHGLAPLWSGGDDDGGGGSGGYGGGSGSSGGSGGGNSSGNYTGWDGDKPNATTVVGGITISEYCQQYNSILVNTTTGQNYTLNPNAWGWTESDGGGLCLNVTTYNNETYATNTTAPAWSATWQYDEGSADQPVHAYPNIIIDGDVLPVKLGKVGMMRLDVQWAYVDAGVAVVGTIPTSTKTSSTKATTATAKTAATTTGTGTVTTTLATTATTPTAAASAVESSSSSSAEAAAPLSTIGTTKAATVAARSVNDVTFSANVAVDMFFDADSDLAGLTANATYEIMVWLAQFGEYTDPIGYAEGIVASQVVADVNFTLYAGTNDKEQHVLTWIAEDAAPKFNGSLLPLITGLATANASLTKYPTSTDYLGYFAFGSEAYYSADEVTFDVERLSMDIW
ncbi:hypothetical protein Sste5346_006702 [Sporothrix stenoceras]|uniref:Uncharacterized protein n=1 Tax=Sporothrix stenoceras TaxID=5173 RepID=A0ABR3YYN6_9PEZI